MRRSLPTRALLRTVNLYQRLTAHRPSPCRYVPSCSEYAREALEIHGAARGSWLSARRLSRCHPFGGFGFDPVPQRDAITHQTAHHGTAVSGRA